MGTPRLHGMEIADFEEGGLYVVACHSVSEGRSHSVCRVTAGVLVEECSGYAIGWHEVQAGLRIEGFFDGAIQAGDEVLATVTPPSVRPMHVTTARVIAVHRGYAWVETPEGDCMVLPTERVERTEGIIDAV